MADAKKCDRCGKFYIANFVGCVILGENTQGNASKHFDLCDECIGKLRHFMNNPSKTDNTIDCHIQTKKFDKCSSNTSSLDTAKMYVRSSSLNTIDRYIQTKEFNKCSSNTLTLDTAKMYVRSSSL